MSRQRFVALDSSCWVAWFDDADDRAPLVDDVVERHDGQLLVPSIVLFEVDRWLHRTSIAAVDIHGALARLAREPSQTVTHSVALRAGALARAHGLATADALIAASASIAGCLLATFDPDFADVPDVLVLAP